MKNAAKQVTLFENFNSCPRQKQKSTYFF